MGRAITEELIDDLAVTSSKIANGAVETNTLADNAVTTSKIKDGNVTTAKIADEAVTEGKIAGCAVSYTKLATGAVRTEKILDGAVTEFKLAGGAVTSLKLANDAVTANKIKDGNVTTAKIADGNVTTAKIADGNVTTAKIAVGAITTSQLANGSVGGPKIRDGGVGTQQIASQAITLEKMAFSSVGSSQIVEGSVNTLQLTNQSVTKPKLRQSTVTCSIDTAVDDGAWHSTDITSDCDTSVINDSKNMYLNFDITLGSYWFALGGFVVLNNIGQGIITGVCATTTGCVNIEIVLDYDNGGTTLDSATLKYQFQSTGSAVIPDGSVTYPKLAGAKIFNLTAYANDDYVDTNEAVPTTLLNGITYSDLVNGENKLFGLLLDNTTLIAGILRQYGGSYYITGNCRERFYSIYILVIGSSITNVFVKVSNMARRTRRTGISQSELTRLSSAVAEQNLEKYGFKVGDSFTIGTRDYVIAGLNPMKGTSTPYRLTENHVGLIVIPHTTQKWNESGNTYTGSDGRGAGYANSDLHHYLVNTLLPTVQLDLGSSHVLAHNKLLSNAVNQTGTNKMGSATGCSSGWGWVSSYISALSEVQVYGSTVWSSSGFDTGEACRQLDVFRVYNHTEIFGGEYPWLRDVVSASYAAIANTDGFADRNTASSAIYVAALVLFK
jgi:hypothetical protein